MLRFLKVFCDIWAFIMAILAAMVVFMLFTKNSDVHMPLEWSKNLEQMAAPSIQLLHQYLGTQYSDFQGYHVDMAYTYLATIILFFFIFFLFLSAVFNDLDHKMKKSMDSWAERRRLRKVQKAVEQEKEEAAQALADRESGALLALETTHIEVSESLHRALHETLASLSQRQHIFAQDNKQLLRFSSSLDGARFAQHLAEMFRLHREELKKTGSAANLPHFKIAIHSLENDSSIFKEENFIWAVLHCIGENRMGVTQQSVIQLNLLRAQNEISPDELRTVPLGTHTNLAGRRTVQLYRLEKDGPIDIDVE